MEKSALDWIAGFLVVIGSLNWGLIGLGGFMDADWNLVNIAFGSIPVLENIIYLLVGLSGIWMLVKMFK